MSELLWKMFKETGDIKYYLLAKRLGSAENEDNDSRGNSTERS